MQNINSLVLGMTINCRKGFTLKRLNKYWLILLSLLIAAPALAAPQSLMNADGSRIQLADIAAASVNGDAVFTGTDSYIDHVGYGGNKDMVYEFKVNESYLQNGTAGSHIDKWFNTYDPNAQGAACYYGSVWSPGIEYFGSGGYVGFFTGSECGSNNTSSWLVFDHTGVPFNINNGNLGKPHTDCSPDNGTEYEEERKIRIIDGIFVDDTNHNGYKDFGDAIWIVYTWYHNGNHVSAFNYTTNSDPIRLLDPDTNSVDKVVEGAFIFRHGDNYYMTYSRNAWSGGYGIFWKRATSVAGLASAYEHQMMMPEGKTWDSGLGRYTYTRAFGHGSAILLDNEWYMFYSLHEPWVPGVPFSSATPAVRRYGYVDKLEFYPNGDIVTPTKP